MNTSKLKKAAAIVLCVAALGISSGCGTTTAPDIQIASLNEYEAKIKSWAQNADYDALRAELKQAMQSTSADNHSLEKYYAALSNAYMTDADVYLDATIWDLLQETSAAIETQNNNTTTGVAEDTAQESVIHSEDIARTFRKILDTQYDALCKQYDAPESIRELWKTATVSDIMNGALDYYFDIDVSVMNNTICINS